ncbi:MAG TPA: hypothetical protein VKQ54_16920 [Caulobacteraceae bacterium]|nr:hypothetical protein [Caulobacteraceae bacterium]
MTSEVVMALYRPHEGKDSELRSLIAQHVPSLLRLELITDRPPLLLKAADGTYVEIFEWVSGAASRSAHEHPEIAHIWEAMEAVADFTNLDSLEEAQRPFAHFSPVSIGS